MKVNLSPTHSILDGQQLWEKKAYFTQPLLRAVSFFHTIRIYRTSSPAVLIEEIIRIEKLGHYSNMR